MDDGTDDQRPAHGHPAEEGFRVDLRQPDPDRKRSLVKIVSNKFSDPGMFNDKRRKVFREPRADLIGVVAGEQRRLHRVPALDQLVDKLFSLDHELREVPRLVRRLQVAVGDEARVVQALKRDQWHATPLTLDGRMR